MNIEGESFQACFDLLFVYPHYCFELNKKLPWLVLLPKYVFRYGRRSHGLLCITESLFDMRVIVEMAEHGSLKEMWKGIDFGASTFCSE